MKQQKTVSTHSLFRTSAKAIEGERFRTKTRQNPERVGIVAVYVEPPRKKVAKNSASL
jgi:hypothetical protein